MSYFNQFNRLELFLRDERGAARPWRRLTSAAADSALAAEPWTEAFVSTQRFRFARSRRDLFREIEQLKRREKPPHHKIARLEKKRSRIEQPEVHYAPLFFDLDANRESLERDEKQALEEVREEAGRLARWFFQRFDGLNPAHVQAWFSGRKGFHLTVRPEVFGIEPHAHLTEIIRSIALELQGDLDLKSLDLAVYTLPRVWRLPNTRHPKSGLYKVELTADELCSLPIDAILDLAKVPRWGR